MAFSQGRGGRVGLSAPYLWCNVEKGDEVFVNECLLCILRQGVVHGCESICIVSAGVEAGVYAAKNTLSWMNETRGGEGPSCRCCQTSARGEKGSPTSTRSCSVIH